MNETAETIVLLQGFSRFDAIGQLNVQTGEWHEYSKSRDHIIKPGCKGFFDLVDGKRVCFFRLDGLLRLRTQDHSFNIGPEVTSSWELMDHRALFRLAHGSTTIFELEYTAFQSMKKIPGDPTPFVDEEDGDFFLFIHRVLEDAERRARIYTEDFWLS